MSVQVYRPSNQKRKVEIGREQDHLQKTGTGRRRSKRDEAEAERNIIADTDTDQLPAPKMRGIANGEENAGGNDVVVKKRKEVVVMKLMKWSMILRQHASKRIDPDLLPRLNLNVRAIEVAEIGTNIGRGRRVVTETTSHLHISIALAIGRIVMIDLEAVIEIGTVNIDTATAVEGPKN